MNAVREWLLIGKYRETINLHLLQSYKVTAMLHLADRVEHPDIKTMIMVIDDGVPIKPERIEQGVTFIREKKADGERIIVACGAGISRSSSFAIAALKEEENLSLVEALREVKKHHPDAFPNPHLWQSLCDYYGEQSDLHDLLWT